MKKYTYIFIFFIFIGNSRAQDYLSFYNLRDYVIQTQNLSPVFLPKYSVSFGTPVNAGITFNSTYKISDVLVASNGGNLKVDIDNLNALAQKSNAINTNIANNLFMLGIKLSKGSLTFFVNTRTNLNWQFSDNFTNVLADGFGRSFSFSNERLRVSSYSEIGIGFTQQFLKKKLALAVRVKSLNGIAHAEIQDNALFSADINDTNWVFNSANATVNTSGFSNESGEEFAVFTGNSGIGVDLGVNYKVTNKLSVDVALNDLGAIDWKENVVNYNIGDTNEAVYEGVDFEGSGDILDEIETTLGDVLETSETKESFSTKLGSKLFASVKYQLSEKNTLQAVYFKDNNPYIDIAPSYAIGYNRSLIKSTFGFTAGSGGVDGDFRFGANFAVQLAFLQLYAAVDDFSTMGGKVQDINSTNVRFGVNFLFGYKRKVILDENVE